MGDVGEKSSRHHQLNWEKTLQLGGKCFSAWRVLRADNDGTLLENGSITTSDELVAILNVSPIQLDFGATRGQRAHAIDVELAIINFAESAAFFCKMNIGRVEAHSVDNSFCDANLHVIGGAVNLDIVLCVDYRRQQQRRKEARSHRYACSNCLLCLLMRLVFDSFSSSNSV